MWRELEDYRTPPLVCPPFHYRKVRREMGSAENGCYGAVIYVPVCAHVEYDQWRNGERLGPPAKLGLGPPS
ncbi:hypothetical protein TNCV_4483531 [Trichonephila clavipes]|nr:hypothetical protein TNCV_4483531 [Trichonephila clavipes]